MSEIHKTDSAKFHIDTSSDTSSDTEESQSQLEDTTTTIWARISLTSVVRLVGAGLLVVSASSFMIEQVSNQNDAVRYMALLGHTLFLGLAGIFCALKLNESRSARTFFAIVVASVPIHFAVLGGMFYSTVQWDGIYNVVQPQTWMASSLLQTFGLLGVGIVVLMPLTVFAMMSLARKHAKSLSGAFLLLNALLLVPVRYPDAVVWLFVAGTAIFVSMERKHFSRQAALKTVEGKVLRFILATPLLIILGRTILFYEGTPWFYSSTITAGGFAMYVLWSRKQNATAGIHIFLGTIVIVSAICAFNEVLPVISIYDAPPVWHVSYFWLFTSSLIALLGKFYVGSHSVPYRIALMLFMFTGVIHMLTTPTWLTTSVAFTGAAITLWAAIKMQQTITFLFSAGALLTCTIYHLHGIVRLSAVSHWGALLAVGALFLVGASLMERKRNALLCRIKSVKTAIHSWGY